MPSSPTSSGPDRFFPHERLDAYTEALEFHRWVVSLRGRLPRGLAELYDQLWRASVSFVLNLAEGGSAFATGEKRRYFGIAGASAGESAAAVDVLAIEVPGLEGLAEARRHLAAAAAMTVGLIRKQK